MVPLEPQGLVGRLLMKHYKTTEPKMKQAKFASTIEDKELQKGCRQLQQLQLRFIREEQPQEGRFKGSF